MTDHDEFLSGFHKTPRREFAERLYVELSEKEEGQSMFTTMNPFVRRAALVFAAMVLVLGAVMVISPAARATAKDWLDLTFGGVTLVVVPDDGSTIDIPLATEEVETVPDDWMAVAEAQQVLPFKLPTVPPEGYTLDSQANVTRFSDAHTNGGMLTMIWVTWWSADGRAAILLTIDDDPERGLHVGENNGATEVSINGLTGVLFRGMWNAENGRYEGAGSLTVMWADGGLKYTLMGERDQGTTHEELLKMADSIE